MKRPQNLHDRIIDATAAVALSIAMPFVAFGVMARLAGYVLGLVAREAFDVGREALTREAHVAVGKSSPKYQVN